MHPIQESLNGLLSGHPEPKSMSDVSILKSAARAATSSSFAMVISDGWYGRMIAQVKTVIETPIGAIRVVAGTLFSVKKSQKCPVQHMSKLVCVPAQNS